MPKYCICCKETKEEGLFSKSYGRHKGGLFPYCKTCMSARTKEYRKKNKEHVDEVSRLCKLRNKENTVKYQREWHKNNRDKCNANNAKRRAMQLNATPSWATVKDIQAFYKLAKTLTMAEGVAYEVDHIVPLLGKDVCGLHCEFNLQVLSAIENRKKNNSWSAL